MSSPERAALRSPFRSLAVAVSAVRERSRRYRAGRLVLLTALGTVLALRLLTAIGAADGERARWAPSATAWTTTVALPAGSMIGPGDTAAVDIPPGLVPDDALTADPTGQRARVDLVAGEIVVASRVRGGSSAGSARTPPGHVAIALDRTSDLFTIGDRVDLHDQIDGGRLAADALVVDVTEGDLAIAVDTTAVGDVVRGLGRGGVVPVLRGG